MSPIDNVIMQLDQALRTLIPGSSVASRPNPAESINNVDAIETKPLAKSATKHVAGLMRINHTGEVCAQALYQGQALTAKLPAVRNSMEQAAKEEIDHLCIGLNLNQGQWDYDLLGNLWEPIDLLKWGFTEEQLLGCADVENITGDAEEDQDNS